MSEATFIVIATSEDGDVTMTVLSAEKLRKRLQENYWGKPLFLPHIQEGETLFDLGAEKGLRIIAGRQITPTPRTVATDWDFDP